MWYTSLNQDTVGVLSTKSQGIPVFSFQDQKKDQQYLTALPDELTRLQSRTRRYSDQHLLFLSSTNNAQSKQTRRFSDELTGAMIWTIDSESISVMKKSENYTFHGRDFRVYPKAFSVDGLIPVYESIDKDTSARIYSTDQSSLSHSRHLTDPTIVWYVEDLTV